MKALKMALAIILPLTMTLLRMLSWQMWLSHSRLVVPISSKAGASLVTNNGMVQNLILTLEACRSLIDTARVLALQTPNNRELLSGLI